MKRKFCFFMVLFLIVFMPHKTKALCDDSEYIRLSRLAQNIKTSYTYNKKNKKFTITLTNLKKDLNVEYLNENKTYNTDKELNFYNKYSGKHTFMIYVKSGSCKGELLITKYVNAPFYNYYADEEICKGIENYSYCKKWSKTNNNVDYYSKIVEYKNQIEEKSIKKEQNKNNENIIFKFIREKYAEYYYIILPVIISVLCLIIYIKNKKESLV